MESLVLPQLFDSASQCNPVYPGASQCISVHLNASQRELVPTRQEPALDDTQASWSDAGHILETQGWHGVGNAVFKAISLSHARSGAQGLALLGAGVGWLLVAHSHSTGAGMPATQSPTAPLRSVGFSGGRRDPHTSGGPDPHTSHSFQPDIASPGKSAQLSSEIKLLFMGLEKENPP